VKRPYPELKAKDLLSLLVGESRILLNSKENSNEAEGIQERVVSISRVAKVVKGGRRFTFSVLVVVGDGTNRVGFGIGKAGEVPDAIKKAADQAKKTMVTIRHVDGSLPFEVNGRFGASKVIMFPAKKGKGIIAGGAVRQIVDIAGLRDVVCKIHGSKNPKNVVRATFDGLQQLMSIEDYAKLRERSPEEVLQLRVTQAGKSTAAATEK
jgi:small subunit ribosomal protein S5